MQRCQNADPVSTVLNSKVIFCNMETADLSIHWDIKSIYICTYLGNNILVIVIGQQKALTNLRSVMIASNSIPFRHTGREESETRASR